MSAFNSLGHEDRAQRVFVSKASVVFGDRPFIFG